jgi:hypothetical protein
MCKIFISADPDLIKQETASASKRMKAQAGQ